MIQTYEPSNDQKIALESLLKWQKEKKTPYITLGGFAGTGKTTLISVFRQELHKRKEELKVAFCSYTGKAARVLKQKLIEQNAVFPKDSVSTIHALIYSPMLDDKDNIIGWERNKNPKFDLIIIDEASMVDERIWSDLLSLGIPIIAVGDHGQLPPISGSFNLVQTPMLRLEEIHRQAKDNPIIKLSILAREKGEIPVGNYGDGIKKISKADYDSGEKVNDLLESYNSETLVLCGYNSTRSKLNNFIRGSKEFLSPEPQVGDRVICLRNNHRQRIYNGMLGTINSISTTDDKWYFAEIKMDGEESNFAGLIARGQFGSPNAINYGNDRAAFMMGDLFDFGYALTVHKAQGSEANRVILFEEKFGKMDEQMWKRWLYTAITRAKEELFIIG